MGKGYRKQLEAEDFPSWSGANLGRGLSQRFGSSRIFPLLGGCAVVVRGLCSFSLVQMLA